MAFGCCFEKHSENVNWAPDLKVEWKEQGQDHELASGLSSDLPHCVSIDVTSSSILCDLLDRVGVDGP